VAHRGNRLDVVQQASTAYAVDRTTGSLRRVDGATFEIGAAVKPLPDASAGLLVFAGPHGLYALDAQRGLLTAPDPLSLETTGGAVSLASRFDTGAAVVDEHGRLWVLDADTGDLIWLDGGKRGVRRGAVTAGAGLLTLADDAPVLVDTATRRADLLDRTTAQVRRSTALDLRAGERIAVSGSPHASRLYLVAGRGLLSVCELTQPECTTAVPLSADATDLGPPVETGGRVFVPDYSTGQVWIVDLRESRVVARPQVLHPRTKFQLLTRDGLVFFNDLDSEKAGVIHLDGGIRQVAKYDPGSPEKNLNGSVVGDGKAPTADKTPPEPPANRPRPPQPPGAQPPPPPDPGPPPPPPPPGQPVVQIVASNAEPFVGDTVTLRATGAPGQPDPTDARWDFNDGQAGNGVQVDHKWDAPRSYQVSVQATFAGGQTATASVTITVSTRPVVRPTLTVQVSGNGSVTGGGFNCTGTCTAQFDPGQRVTLTAAPSGGDVLRSWGDACAGTPAASPCTVTMTADRTASATFGPPPPVHLSVTAPANGRITGPNGISCPGTCGADFTAGTPVTLTATPNPNFVNVGWGRDCAAAGRGTTCNLTMNGPRTASVAFDSRKQLTVDSTQFEPDGGAGVQGPPGLCQTHCVWTFDPGQSVTLTAVDQGLDFKGWGGDCKPRGTNQTCVLTMNRDRAVSAAFDAPQNAQRNAGRSAAVRAGRPRVAGRREDDPA